MSLPKCCKYGTWVLLAQKNGCGGLRGLPQFFSLFGRVWETLPERKPAGPPGKGVERTVTFLKKIGVMPEKRKDRDK